MTHQYSSVTDQDDFGEYAEYIEEARAAVDESDWRSKIEKAVASANKMEDAADELEERAKKLRDGYKHFTETVLPDLMRQMGQDKARMMDGTELMMEDKIVDATLAAEKNPKRDLALAWLVESGNGDLVKTDVMIRFDKGQEEAARALLNEMRAARPDLLVALRREANTNSVTALLNERRRKSEKSPVELFNAREVKRVKIKRAKKAE